MKRLLKFIFITIPGWLLTLYLMAVVYAVIGICDFFVWLDTENVCEQPMETKVAESKERK